jgi:hypothetical protein
MSGTRSNVPRAVSTCLRILQRVFVGGVSYVMARDLARNVITLLAIAVTLLTVFEMSNHRVPILPADASPGPVVAGALLFGVAVTLVERRVRRRLR